jgi:hypothetical protein
MMPIIVARPPRRTAPDENRLIPDRVVAIFDCYGPDPFALLGAAVIRSITYQAYAGSVPIPRSYLAVIEEDFIWSYGPLPKSSKSNKPGMNFEDEIGTRNKGNFGLTHLFYVTIDGIRRRMQIQAFGEVAPLTWENNINASNDKVLVNGKAGSPCN